MATPSTDHGRPTEAEQILTSLDAVSPTSMTSCPGWSAHHLAAHIAGSYQEVRYHLEAFASGHPPQKTRSFEERESPLYGLPHADLLTQTEREEAAMRQVLSEVLSQTPEARLQWTGRTVDVAGFGTHTRSEDAVHRWDLVGDDETSAALLGQQELLNHAVKYRYPPVPARAEARCRRPAAYGHRTDERARRPQGDDGRGDRSARRRPGRGQRDYSRGRGRSLAAAVGPQARPLLPAPGRWQRPGRRPAAAPVPWLLSRAPSGLGARA